MREFNCSHRLVSQAKNILETKGVLSTPNPSKGKSLPVEVKDFYYSDTISRAMPGKKDFLTVMEVFQLFTEKYPNTRIGFSKFAELRPKECVLAGSSSTRCVCVCTIHQNVKLMIVGSHMDDLQLEEEAETPIKNYKQASATIQCNPFLPACPIGRCKNCPGVATLKEWLLQCFKNKGIEEIEYKQSTTTDRSQLQTLVQSTDEFIKRFLNHGKGPYDGVGGRVKHEAARTSLQRPYNDQIMTTYKLYYMFAKENIHGISFEYLTANDWQIESTALKERLSNARTIQGTYKLHCFKPLSTNELQVQ
ncbi:unnamed protein product [Rotaria socialis]|uniref:Uncharacterized protein n=1 Tax=Rotaria socialis TaxID=392032 RepID=A0A821TNA1_9BILA|nr:unnamed protein product [Rotaria socialis]